jgi:hypothetical protein
MGGEVNIVNSDEICRGGVFPPSSFSHSLGEIFSNKIHVDSFEKQFLIPIRPFQF